MRQARRGLGVLVDGGPQMIVPVKGAELFYSSRGSGPVCLVLSAIGTRPYEAQTPPQLSDRLRLVYVDLRGSGRSEGEPTDLTFDVLAIEYSRRCPRSVSHVIAVGTPPSGDIRSAMPSSLLCCTSAWACSGTTLRVSGRKTQEKTNE